jgi:hypothetical protein
MLPELAIAWSGRAASAVVAVMMIPATSDRAIRRPRTFRSRIWLGDGAGDRGGVDAGGEVRGHEH